ncbi:hypothetical protein HK18_01425, partial [Commensalibacter intestini]
MKSVIEKAHRGDITSQNFIAISYLTGQGAPKDYKKALYWYTKAADQRNVDAQFQLGEMYFKGQGVPQNYDIAGD